MHVNVGNGDFWRLPWGPSPHAPVPALRLSVLPAVAPFKESANHEIGGNIGSRDSVTPVTERDNEKFKNSSIHWWKSQ